MSNKTKLYSEHISLNARMFEFGGYLMPIKYESALQEQEWVRENVGIFDVSHMGQLMLQGKEAVDLLMQLTPSDFSSTPVGRAKYTVLLNKQGGIVDDLIVAHIDDNKFLLVVNAARKEEDIKWINNNITDYANSIDTGSLSLKELQNRSLIAIQGNSSYEVLSRILVSLPNLPYMMLTKFSWKGKDLFVSRVGYTGEDGFEVSIDNEIVVDFWHELMKSQQVKPIGLAARDGLRLEAGYPLFGSDLDETTSPIEANLAWVVSSKNNRFYGHGRILKEKKFGASRKRVSLKLAGRALAKKNYSIYSKDGIVIGKITSGAFSPVADSAIAQAYVDTRYANLGENILVEIRGSNVAAQIHKLSFLKSKTISSKAI
jgi:aminomethyltransferase